MPTAISLFDYLLPPERIAQASVEPRDRCRLLVLDKQTGERRHMIFHEIAGELRAGDVLVMNQTKVFKARLFGRVGEKKIEVFLLREREGVWEVLLKPGRAVTVGSKIDLPAGLAAKVLAKGETARVKIEATTEEVLAMTEKFGEVPVPPYVKSVPSSLDQYQTVYARDVGSVAAPTAGFHFTNELIEKLKDQGVQFEFLTLHVGIGTFRPIKTETLEEHRMHAEFVEIDKETARRINQAKKEGRRIVAVGTTTVRALEGVAGGARETEGARVEKLPEEGYGGEVNLFITPGFQFKIVDALITNFHLPKSSLLVLVSALAGRENVLAAYEEAVQMKYRFYSFGDAMFIE
jgi:S-adenosylmethionine:tRNA ribosyltransferase-isomerase